MPKQRVFIIGAGGMVGATAAQALTIKEVASEIILIDIDQELANGQAMDINHAAAYTHGVNVRTGDYSQIREDDIIVITCGAAQEPGQSRLELASGNAAVVRDVVHKVMAQGKLVYILMVTNPVDILTQLALEVSGLPKERVLGTGTTLDTARLRVMLANALHVSQRSIEAYVLGEHGDSSFPALSSATIGGIPLPAFPGFQIHMLDGIDEEIRQSASKIIEAKKSTYYGIGHVIAKIVEALMHDTASIFPVCSQTSGEYGLNNVTIGLPSLVSSRGVTILDHYPLSEAEQHKLHASAEIILKAKNSLGAN